MTSSPAAPARDSGRSRSSRSSGSGRHWPATRAEPGIAIPGTAAGRAGERREDEHHVELTGDAMEDAKKVGSELVGAARDSAASLIDAQRARAAEQITAVGDALRRSTESFEASGSSALVQYANQAADQICGFADTVRDRSWSDLAGDLESFARRSPTAVPGLCGRSRVSRRPVPALVVRPDPHSRRKRRRHVWRSRRRDAA